MDDALVLSVSLHLENNALRRELQPSRLRAISTTRNWIRGTATKQSTTTPVIYQWYHNTTITNEEHFCNSTRQSYLTACLQLKMMNNKQKTQCHFWNTNYSKSMSHRSLYWHQILPYLHSVAVMFPYSSRPPGLQNADRNFSISKIQWSFFSDTTTIFTTTRSNSKKYRLQNPSQICWY